MRSSEIVEIKPGSIEPLERRARRDPLAPAQQADQRPASRRDGPRPGHVIGPVIDAIEILERMHPNGPDDPLLPMIYAAPCLARRTSRTLRLNVGGLLRDLIAWQNTSGARAGLRRSRDVDGPVARSPPRQFRRTLAREIAFSPPTARSPARSSSKHVPRARHRGLLGPAGESSPAIHRRGSTGEQRAASEQRIRQRFEEWQQGLPIRWRRAAPPPTRVSPSSPASSTASPATLAERRTTPAKTAAQTLPTRCTSGSSTTATSTDPLPSPLPEERVNNTARRAADRRLPARCAVRPTPRSTTTTSPRPGEA